jgi:putative thioredoxin
MNTTHFVFDATEENFQQGVIENSYKAPVLVDFWAEWCEPCKQLMPILEKLATDMRGQFVLAKVNSETQQALGQQFRIRSIPTVLIFKNGEVVDQFTGLLPQQAIRETIEKHIITEAEIIRNNAIEAIQAGDFTTGKAKLLEAETLAPENATIQIDLAHLEAQQKEYAEAKNRLSHLKLAEREKDEVVSLLNKIELTLSTENAPSIDELLKIIEATPDESLARYQLATQLINQEDFETGLKHLLYILQRDGQFQDNAAQKAMLSTFTLMDDDNPLVGQYRRKMFNAMH